MSLSKHSNTRNWRFSEKLENHLTLVLTIKPCLTAIFKSFCVGWLGLLVPFKHGFDQGQSPKKFFKKYYRLTLVAPFFSYSYKHTHFAPLDAPWPFSGWLNIWWLMLHGHLVVEHSLNHQMFIYSPWGFPMFLGLVGVGGGRLCPFCTIGKISHHS